ncbi:MAG: DNA repair protein RecN [Rickettsiales bacterium]|nr:DNA repair protein RecN [Rickettsiales bacterium]
MLKSLAINNIVLIDKAEIEFSLGLCVLSGETGSGKSILLDALGLAIGLRSNSRLIGNIQNKSQVNAEFIIKNNSICKKLLQEHDLLDPENPDHLRIRRSIENSQEKLIGKVYVNDIAIGVNLLGEIGETLIEIHGQHDQRGLLNSSFHAQILDEFSGNQDLLKDLKKICEELRKTDAEILTIQNKKEQLEREKDYLQFIIKELEDADVKAEEENELTLKKDQLNAKEKILTFCKDLKSNLVEANSNLVTAQRIIIRNQNIISNYLSDWENNFEKLNEKIDQQNIEIETAISAIKSLENNLNNSAENLDEIEERLFFIRGLARKFSTSTNQLEQVIIDSRHKLDFLQNEEESGKKLLVQKNNLLKNYHQIAKQLSLKRAESAVILAKKIEEELQFLKMNNTRFLVEINSINNGETYSSNGYDQIRFTASINKNNFDDIAKIASGGELSRFMLALKVALMNVKSTPTIIFDEIDSGIGGSTADAVGKRLKALAQNVQILVVTHQPQIAAKADTHFKISKISNDEKIKTIIEKLSEKNRQDEIARMLSGEQISIEALAAANRLILES